MRLSPLRLSRYAEVIKMNNQILSVRCEADRVGCFVRAPIDAFVSNRGLHWTVVSLPLENIDEVYSLQTCFIHIKRCTLSLTGCNGGPVLDPVCNSIGVIQRAYRSIKGWTSSIF